MLNGLDNLLFERFRLTVRAQALFRIMFASFLLTSRVRLWGLSSAEMADIPADLWFPPVGLAQVVPIPDPATLQVIHLALVALSFLLLIGWQTRSVSLLITLLLIVVRLREYSFGKVDHDILLVIVPACLAFSRWGHYLSMDAWRRGKASGHRDQDAWPFALLALLIAFGMANSGVQKIIGGWLDPSTLATVGWIVYCGEILNKDSFGYCYIDTLLAAPHAGLKSLDWITVLFELAFVVAIFKRRWFQTICLLAVLFHCGTKLLFDIYFLHQIPAYAALFPWDRIFGSCAAVLRLEKWERALSRPRVLGAGGAFMGAALLVSRIAIPWGAVYLVGFTLLACVGLFSIGWRTAHQPIYRPVVGGLRPSHNQPTVGLRRRQ